MKEKKRIFVGIDRDATMIYDDKYYLGSQENWKSLIKFLPGVILGIKKLRKIEGVKMYMLTNQPGVAITDLPLLTEERAHEVCLEVMKRLDAQGAKLDGYVMCPHASPEYMGEKKDRKFERRMVCSCDCIKPSPGMILRALKELGWKRRETEIFMIGDRASDVQAGLNSGGFGILVPWKEKPGEKGKVEKINSERAIVVGSFSDAVKFVLGKV